MVIGLTQDDGATRGEVPSGNEAALLMAQANRLMADVCRMQGKYELAVTHLQSARSALDATGDSIGIGADVIERCASIRSDHLKVWPLVSGRKFL